MLQNKIRHRKNVHTCTSINTHNVRVLVIRTERQFSSATEGRLKKFKKKKKRKQKHMEQNQNIRNDSNISATKT